MIPTLSALVLSAAPLAQELPQEHTHPVQHLVAVELDVRQLRRFQALDLDIAYVDLVAGAAQVVATDEELSELDDAGFPYRVMTEDIARWYAARLAQSGNAPAGGPYGGWLSPPFGQGGMGGYYTFADIVSVLDQMAAAYPTLVTPRASLGQTLQGRDLWMVKISDNPGADENEPEVRFDAMHHAREPQGMQTTLWFMLYLLEEYGTDPLATYLVDEREIWFVPCVNPDGYEYNRQIAPGGGGMWRKNRRNNGGGSFGVDLNRNYPYQWGFDNNGSSSNPDSGTYRGTGPQSEPAVQAMVSFISGRDFATALSVHTFSNLWLSPWGYDEIYPANRAEYEELGELATEVNGYPYGTAWEILYEANGVTIDYDHGQHGTLSWTPEIGSSNDGFWPAQSRIVPLAEENLLAFQRTALAGGAFVRANELAIVDAGDGDGSFEGGESVELTAKLRNSGTQASGTIDLALTSSSPNVTITTSMTQIGSLASFTDGENAQPLALMVLAGTPVGTTIPFTVTVTYQGFAQDFLGEILIGTEITLAAFDFEAGGNQGWSVGNPNDASTGTWTRVDPRGTAAQPEDDHTDGAANTRCWVTGQGSVGGSLGENDVDAGSTTLVSPAFDLEGVLLPRISYWRWYSNDTGSAPNADIFQVDVSNDDGQSWVAAETVGPTGPDATGGWREVALDVDALIATTDQMRVRFIASDLSDGSIVEAALDDVRVTYLEGETCSPPANYCVTTPNSAGPGAVMSWAGSTDVTDANFDLVANGSIASQFGLFFYGPGQDQVPAGNGFLCVGGGFFRLPAVGVDGGGQAVFSVDFDSLPAGGQISNGSTWNFQFWYRDPMAGVGSNFSDGLEVEFCAD